VLSPDCRQRDRIAIAYLSLLGLTAVRDLACAEARRRCSGYCCGAHWGGALSRRNQRSNGPIQSDTVGKSMAVRVMSETDPPPPVVQER